MRTHVAAALAVALIGTAACATDVVLGERDVRGIAAGASHTCAVRGDAPLGCWGLGFA
jgi:hypothetical protein